MAFHQLVNAVQQKEVDLLEARTKEITTVKKAEADGQAEILKARSEYASRANLAKAEAERFQIQNKAYRDSAEVFKVREFLSALEESIRDARKYVIGMKGLKREHVRLNLEDPSRLEITDIGEFEKPIMPEEKKRD